MDKNGKQIVSHKCYQEITLSHGFNSVDEKSCSRNRLAVYAGGFHRWTENDEIQNTVEWHSQMFTRVGCKPMNFILSINSFRCLLLGL